MSFPATQLGGGAFNHSQSRDAEQEYDRLRGLARQEHDKRSRCLDQAHQAYTRGDGAAAHQLSEEGKRHGQMMDQFNRQASEYIFRENNAEARVPSDTIDLHGQFVEEAEDILEQRIRFAQSQGQSHLHVIVGKGNHSTGHIQKIKPRVEQVCRELGLQYATEENAGRMYINLQGGPATMPNMPHGGYAPGYGGGNQHHGGGQQYPHQQPHQGGQHGYPGGPQGGQQGGQQNQNAEIEQAVKKLLPRIFRKLEGCCVIM
ncbi:MAG: hypothetical protein M4579_006646 [Chaenotheca gracillima]|nr:MAG: hypothetical protein M4579_006646 [Chaenotheca gracillima]